MSIDGAGHGNIPIKIGAKPIVNEVGPYVYREVRIKEDILEVDRDKIKYGLYMEYHFDKDQTEASGCKNCDKDDDIVVLNGALMAATGLLGGIPVDKTLA